MAALFKSPARVDPDVTAAAGNEQAVRDLFADLYGATGRRLLHKLDLSPKFSRKAWILLVILRIGVAD